MSQNFSDLQSEQKIQRPHICLSLGVDLNSVNDLLSRASQSAPTFAKMIGMTHRCVINHTCLYVGAYYLSLRPYRRCGQGGLYAFVEVLRFLREEIPQVLVLVDRDDCSFIHTELTELPNRVLVSSGDQRNIIQGCSRIGENVWAEQMKMIDTQNLPPAKQKSKVVKDVK